MQKRKALLVLLILYGVASLIHFIHNAEFLADYPNLPSSWTRAGVYLVWLGITTLGISGWLLIHRGFQRVGLLVVALYAFMGIDSLAHYIVAPMSAHTVAMNTTILLEVITAGMLLIGTVWLLGLRMVGKTHQL